MTIRRHLLALAVLLVLPVSGVLRHAAPLAGSLDPVALVAAQPAPSEQQTEFVPIDELPPQDQLPAAPLLVTAYVVVIVAFFGYVFSLMRRLGGVQAEITRLESELKRPR